MSRIFQRLTRRILIALIAASSAGCASVSYKAVSFDVLRPAVYTLPAWADSVIIVDGVEQPGIIDSVSTFGTGEAKQNKRDVRLCRDICKALAAAFNESGYLKAAIAQTNPDKRGLTDAAIDSLLRDRRHTVILSLNTMNSDSRINVESGTVGESFVICGQITAATETAFELIVSPTSRFALKHRNDTLLFRDCDNTLDDLAHRLPKIFERYEEQGKYVGQKQADAFIPVWQTVYRSYYVSSDPDMLAAKTWVDQNNWDEATNLWARASANARSKGDRVRAMLNVALAYEREDDPIMAGIWCSRAIDAIEALAPKDAEKLTIEKEKAEVMFAYLIERQRQKETLDLQMQ